MSDSIIGLNKMFIVLSCYWNHFLCLNINGKFWLSPLSLH